MPGLCHNLPARFEVAASLALGREMKPVGSLQPVVVGDCIVAPNPHADFQVILGSCVAACIWDPHAKIGGVNHFLVPTADADDGPRDLKVSGAFLMERLVRSLLARGASLHRLKARLYGGAYLFGSRLNIGKLNAEYATAFLKQHGIALLSSDVGGNQGRWLHVWPAEGRVEARLVGEPAQLPN